MLHGAMNTILQIAGTLRSFEDEEIIQHLAAHPNPKSLLYHAEMLTASKQLHELAHKFTDDSMRKLAQTARFVTLREERPLEAHYLGESNYEVEFTCADGKIHKLKLDLEEGDVEVLYDQYGKHDPVGRFELDGAVLVEAFIDHYEAYFCLDVKKLAEHLQVLGLTDTYNTEGSDYNTPQMLEFQIFLKAILKRSFSHDPKSLVVRNDDY